MGDEDLGVRVLDVIVARIYIKRLVWALAPRKKVASMRDGNEVIFGAVDQQHRARYSVNFCRVAESVDGFLRCKKTSFSKQR